VRAVRFAFYKSIQLSDLSGERFIVRTHCEAFDSTRKLLLEHGIRSQVVYRTDRHDFRPFVDYLVTPPLPNLIVLALPVDRLGRAQPSSAQAGGHRWPGQPTSASGGIATLVSKPFKAIPTIELNLRSLRSDMEIC
jgi:hypothetical protein